jgi:hypothetical protein
LGYGRRALLEDAASERTHVVMMQLHLMAGDRTAALRQFDMCRGALMDELGVPPEASTIRLRDQIGGGYPEHLEMAPHAHDVDGVGRSVEWIHTTIIRLHELRRTISQLREEVSLHIHTLERLEDATNTPWNGAST